jgi:hypothetical protein
MLASGLTGEDGGELSPAVYAGLDLDGPDVVVHRVWRQGERGRDLLAGLPGQQQAGDHPLRGMSPKARSRSGVSSAVDAA